MAECTAPAAAGTNRAALQIEIVSDLALPAGAADAWNGLVDASVYPNVFLRWEWVHTWWKWFGGRRELRVIRVTKGSELVAIVPLYVLADRSVVRFRPRTWSFLGFGGPTCPEYLGPIVHRDYVEPVVGAAADYLGSPEAHWSAIVFPDAAPDDPGTTALVDALCRRFPSVSRNGEICPYLRLPESYESLLARVSANRRKQERRRLRRVQREFEVRLDVLESPAEVEAFFPTLVQLNRSSRGRLGEVSPFAGRQYAGFHREVIAKLLPESVARLFVLRFDGNPVAFQYGFAFHGRYGYFQSGFDCRWAHWGPGGVLFQLVFLRLIEEGIREFDFLRGDEAYKTHFADMTRRTTTTVVFRRGGAAYRARVAWERAVRPLCECIRQSVVAAVRRGSRRTADSGRESDPGGAD